MKIRNKGNFSTSIVLGWMFLLAIAFVVLVFSGSSSASAFDRSLAYSQELKTTIKPPTKYVCGEMQAVTVKYSLRKKQARLSMKKFSRLRAYSKGPLLFTFKLPEPWVVTYKDGFPQFGRKVDSITAMLLGMKQGSVTLSYGKSISMPVFYIPPC